MLGDQLDDNTNQILEAKPEENKQRLEELEEELSLTIDDANPTIAESEKHTLKTPSDFELQHSKRVRIRFDIKYSTFSGRKVIAIQDPERIGT